MKENLIQRVTIEVETKGFENQPASAESEQGKFNLGYARQRAKEVGDTEFERMVCDEMIDDINLVCKAEIRDEREFFEGLLNGDESCQMRLIAAHITRKLAKIVVDIVNNK